MRLDAVRSDQAEVEPGNQRNMFQSDEGNVIDGQKAEGG